MKLKKLDNNLLYFFYFTIIFSPPIAMISGLFMAPWIGGTMIIMLLLVGLNLEEIRSSLSVIEKAIIGWAILSCFWSISPIDSLLGASRLILVLAIYHVIRKKLNLLKIPGKNFTKYMAFSLIAAVIIFLIEKYTAGIIVELFRGVFQPDKEHYFYLFWLDRGCSMLSVFAWVPIYLFLRAGDFKKAIISYLLVLSILLISDSDASIVAFICGAIGFSLSYFLKGKFRKLIAVFMMSYIFLMPGFSKMQDPYYLDGNPVKLPLSYVHRLFIWKYSMEISKDSLFLGKGIDSARAIEVPESRIITYKGVTMSPMPRHPHNSVIQVVLELGLVGLILFGAYIWRMLDKFSHIASKDRPFGSAIYGMFINYFVIGLISFSMWQNWWLLVILFACLTMNLAKCNE